MRIFERNFGEKLGVSQDKTPAHGGRFEIFLI